jgi:hypothetical protein
LGKGLNIDVQAILTGRGCIIGQSGSGKSFLMGVIAEELCRLNMAFCVIDTEGEYGSLKSMFNIIIVGGDNKDIELDTDFQKLFRTSIINNIPVVLDVSDVVDKSATVNGAIEALYQLENKIRKPYLVLIEEADKLAPQIISKKINTLEEISVRGRKRGIGILIATQRPANISKNVLSQCSYGFIGKLTIENDLNAIRILFGSHERLVSVTKLKVGEFIPFGLENNKIFKVKERLVKHIGSTPLIDVHKPMNDKIEKIIKELKENKPKELEVNAPKEIYQTPKKKADSADLSIYAMPASFTADDAEIHGERIAKRKFVLFGEATERIGIELQYLPLGLCSFRIPVRRNEYLEYYTLINDKGKLVGLDSRTGFSVNDYKKEPSSYNRYLKKGVIPSEKISIGKDRLINSDINERKAAACIKKFFPAAVLTEFRLLYIPVYKMTLRKDNRVRVFTIDGVYGKEIEL